MNQIWRWLVGACLLMTAVGCSGGPVGTGLVDGGPVGTGIAASVTGNVVTVGEGAALADSTGMGGAVMPQIGVAIDEVPGSATTTDAQGNFHLEGEFAGRLTLRFTTPTYAVAAPLEVPAGSTIVLEDVRLAPEMVQMTAVRQLGFLGVIAHSDCDGGVLLVNDRQHVADQFMVRLFATTSILDGNGHVLQCAAVQTGQQVVVRGIVQPTDQTVGALAVIVEPQATDQVQFAGTVMMIDCDAAVLMVWEATATSGTSGMPGMPGMGMPGMIGMAGRSRVRLLPTTDIADSAGHPLQCQTIRAGDHVECSGIINSTNPGAIDAQTMTVSTAS